MEFSILKNTLIDMGRQNQIYLVRTFPTEKELEKLKSEGTPIRNIKAHIWCEERNNTWCNMYKGMRESQPDSTIFDSRWALTNENQLYSETCIRCIKNKKKGLEFVKDASDLESPSNSNKNE